MAIGSITPKDKHSRRGKKVVDENSPLLPTRREGDAGYGGEVNGASFTGAVFNLSTTIVGAGIMALPATMKVLGLVLGIALIIFMAFLTDASIELLLRFSRAGKSVSYGGLMGEAFGKWGKVLLQLSVLINNVGVLIVYMIIIGDVLSGTSSSGVHHAGVLEGWFGDHWWNGRTFVLLVTTLGIFSPLACFKRIVHSIDNELEDSTHIKGVVRTSLALCSTVYIMTSIFGFLLFGDATLDDVLANFDADLGIPFGSVLSDVVRVSYAAHLMLVFPVIFYPLRLNLDGLLFPSARPLGSSNTRFAFISSGLLIIIFLGANFIPSIWDAFQFTGATAAVCLGFIFPAAITLRDRHSIATKKDKILCIFMIVLAVFSNVVAIYSDAFALFKKNASPSE
ncbi:Amino acid transporter AVT6A [Citrus sinensis]|uniref:Amino acid transporter AVT6A n=1 Tax=Citrus sinensis TaxID=2711 RepID=A0ACB8K4G0_CITSI|nr:Amino acid transporter AVT6A [Citrus sinensis]